MANLRARSIEVPGLNPGFDGAAKISLSSIDDQIRGLPGLIHYIDPGDLAERNVRAYDRASGAPYWWPQSSVTKAADGGAAWGNKPVLNFSDKTGYLMMAPAEIPRSFSVLMVAATADAAAMTETVSTLAATYGPGVGATGLDMVYRWEKPNAGDTVGMGLKFESNFAQNTFNGPSTSGINTGGSAPYVWGFSYNADAKTSKLYGHADVILPTSTKTDHASNGLAAPGAFWTFMGAPYPSGTAGMRGKLGKILIFDRDMSGALNGYFIQARALLRQFYGLA